MNTTSGQPPQFSPAPLPSPAPAAPAAPAHAAWRSPAIRIAIYYLVFGIIWIVVSDWLLNNVLHLPSRYQTLKGTFFIIVTSALLFLLVRHYVISLQKTQSGLQKKLEGIANHYKRLFEHNPSAMLIYDPDTRQIFAANDVSLLVYGYSREELLSMKTLQLVVEEERPRAAAISPYPAKIVHPIGVWQCRRRDGRIIFIEAVTHEVDYNGKPARIAMITDVTDRLHNERALSNYRTQLEQRVAERTAELSLINRQLRAEVSERQRVEESLRAATAAAQTASDTKSTFLANTSHEIRTPLTSILGYSDLLADDTLTLSDRAKYLDVLQQNARHLLALIDDLLDLSRAETGKVSINFSDESPREIAQQAIDLLHPRVAEKALNMTVQYAEGTPEKIRTDGVRLRQFLLNLLSNAIKFTPCGAVTLRISPFTKANQTFIRFDISDTGIGMPSDHLHRVFEPFYQIDHGMTRRFGGSGLGLAISRQLSQQMGGELSVVSTPGAGSTFTLLLPASHVTAAAPQVTAPSAAAVVPAADPHVAGPMPLHGHILLADDNANIRLLVVEYLRRAGARVTAVVNGAEAVQHIEKSLATQAAGGETYDLVLLDLHMPVLDGAEALRQIRQLGYAGPIVGLTADYSEKPPAQWTSEGWVAMAPKPVDRQAFIPMLASLMSPATASK